MTSIAINFKNLAIGLAAIGLTLGAAFGAGIAYGRSDDSSSASSGPNIQDLIGARGGTGATAGNGGFGGFQSVLGTMGAITAIDGDTITIGTVQGDKQIHTSNSTAVSLLQPAALGDLEIGIVVAFGGEARDDGSIDATTIDEVASQLQSLSSGGAVPGNSGGTSTTGSSGTSGGTGSRVPGASGAPGGQAPDGGNTPQPTATLEIAPAATPAAAQTPGGTDVSPPTTGEGQLLPDRTSCDEIRGTEYRSVSERQFFLDNCVSGE